jgi:hypothetical protein
MLQDTLFIFSEVNAERLVARHVALLPLNAFNLPECGIGGSGRLPDLDRRKLAHA